MQETDKLVVGNDDEQVRVALLRGLGDGAKLRASHEVEFGRMGLDLAPGLSVERWRDALQWLRLAGESMTYWLADAVKYGRGEYGDEVVEAAVVQLEFEQHVVDTAVMVGKMGRGVRRPGLNGDHYFVLSKVAAEVQEYWADLAVEHRLTGAELEASIKAGKVVRKDVTKVRSGLATIQGVRCAFDRWRRAALGAEPLETWPAYRLEELREELEPVLEVARELERLLEDDEI